MHNKQGFMLLQVVVGTMIAAVISMILMSSLAQMTKVSQLVDQMYDHTFHIMMMQKHLERDITGMCVPLQAIAQEEKKNENATVKKEAAREQNSAKSAQKEKAAVLNKVFFAAITDNKQMQQLTFISNNPTKTYWQGAVGSAKPKLVRITYFLQKDPDHQDSFILMRKENNNLAFTKEDNTKAYAITSHIQSFALTFTYETVETEKKDGAEKQKKSSPAQVNSWNSDELLNGENKYASLLPSNITIQIQLWNNAYTKTTLFTMTIPILSNGFNAPIVRKQKTGSSAASPAKTSAEEQPPKQAALEIDSMKEAVKNLKNQPENGVRIASDVPKRRKKNKLTRSSLPTFPFPGMHFK